ncbi:hypothetical protein DFH09DRAFT_1126124, partial [Mycena vulgaris]
FRPRRRIHASRKRRTLSLWRWTSRRMGIRRCTRIWGRTAARSRTTLRPSPQTTSRPSSLGARALDPAAHARRPARARPRALRDPTGPALHCYRRRRRPALLPRRRCAARARRGLAVEGARALLPAAARHAPARHAPACTAEEDLGRGARSDFGEETACVKGAGCVLWGCSAGAGARGERGAWRGGGGGRGVYGGGTRGAAGARR